MSEHLERLRELTGTLSLFPPAVIEKPGYTEWKVKNGKCFAWYLFEQKEISVCRTFLTKGTIFPKHSHKEKELIIIYEGKITLYTQDNCYELGYSDSYIVEPNIDHAVEANENSMVLAITLPAAKEYPHDTKI